jgi:hypothetical protein
MFDSELSIEAASETTWRLTRPLVWTGTQGDTFVVPTDFVTDFASVPRFMHWLVLPYGAYTRAAVLHDYLIVHLINHPDPTLRVPSRDADGIFRRVMHDLGVPWTKRWVMWAAVRAASLFSPGRARGRQFLRDAPAVIGMFLLAAPIVLPGALGVGISLPLARLATWVTGRPITRRRLPNARRDSAAPHERIYPS